MKKTLSLALVVLMVVACFAVFTVTSSANTTSIDIYGHGMENWVNSPNKGDAEAATQILFCPKPWVADVYKDYAGKDVTVKMATEDATYTFAAKIATLYNGGSWGIFRVEPCLNDPCFVPVKDVQYTATFTFVDADGETVTMACADPYYLDVDPIVPAGKTAMEPDKTDVEPEPPVDENKIEWSLKDGVLTISGKGEMEDYRGKESERPWADKLEEITKIVVSDGITKVGSSSFTHCAAATEITFGKDVKELGMDAFSYCDALQTVTFNGPVETIGQGIVYSTNNITKVTITGQTVEEFKAVASVKPYNLEANGGIASGLDTAEYVVNNTTAPVTGEATIALVIIAVVALFGTAVVASKKVFSK